MKTGKSLSDLAAELMRINQNKADFVVPTGKLKAEVVEDKVALTFENGKKHAYGLNNWSGGQLASYTDIPK